MEKKNDVYVELEKQYRNMETNEEKTEEAMEVLLSDYGMI